MTDPSRDDDTAALPAHGATERTADVVEPTATADEPNVQEPARPSASPWYADGPYVQPAPVAASAAYPADRTVAAPGTVPSGYAPAGTASAAYAPAAQPAGYAPGGYAPAGYAPASPWAGSAQDSAYASGPGSQPPRGHLEPGPVDTLGRAPRPARGAGPVVVLAVLLSLVAGLLGGFVGGAVEDSVALPGFGDKGGSLPFARGGDGAAGDADASPTTGAGPSDTLQEGSVAEIAARVLPSVVSIQVESAGGAGTGSGFVIDPEGLILTNNHVIAGAADGGQIVVEFANGSQLDAEVVGTEVSYDVAVLRVDRTGLTALPFGDSDAVQVGEQVVAVGAPLGLSSTVTTGIISALNRPVSAGDAASQAFINAIQTDAAINPGNSGGPLVNLRGEVVGMNSAIAQAPGGQIGGSIGLGFAIPSNQAGRTAGQLIETGVATFPVIGVLLDSRYTGEGVQILAEADAADAEGGTPIVPGGAAEAAGLQPGDVVLAFQGRPVTAPDELIVAVRALEPGDEVTLTVRRGDEVFDVDLTLQAGG